MTSSRSSSRPFSATAAKLEATTARIEELRDDLWEEILRCEKHAPSRYRLGIVAELRDQLHRQHLLLEALGRELEALRADVEAGAVAREDRR